MVETTTDVEAENVVDIAPSGTCIYKVISDIGKTNMIFRLPEEEDALSAMMSAIPDLRDASERLSRTKCITISPDQNTVAALWKGGSISVYDIKTGNRLWGRRFSDYVKIIEFSPDGKKLWFTSDTNRELSIDTGEEALNRTSFSIPYADKLVRVSPNPLPLAGPVYWVWSGEKDRFAAQVYSDTVISGNGGLFIFDPHDPYLFNAKQCIPTYLPEPAWTFNRAGGAEIKPIGFVGKNLLLVESKRSMLPASWKRVTELICIDLREVPEI
ncbi:MAG: hypothetical protein JXR40_03750 [Pontiellaceae bacterium]|nr:hypothetical protein [Pontiellaceae bacterium]